MLRGRRDARARWCARRGSNANASGGVYMDKGQEYVIRGIGRVQSADDIATTVVARRAVASRSLSPRWPTCAWARRRSYGDGSVNAKPAVVLAVQKQPGANTLELTRAHREELADDAAHAARRHEDPLAAVPAGRLHHRCRSRT